MYSARDNKGHLKVCLTLIFKVNYGSQQARSHEGGGILGPCPPAKAQCPPAKNLKKYNSCHVEIFFSSIQHHF